VFDRELFLKSFLMKLICKQLGGSHSYGLNTPKSDVDYRGIFLNTDLSSVIGLKQKEHQTSQSEEEDKQYWEFRNAMKLLRQSNSQVVELLYCNEWVELSPEWEEVIKHREELVDSKRLFSMLRGYMQGEARLANGERQGKLGGKRKAAIEKYGFSPKNFVQLFRLAWAGQIYFQKGYFPVKVSDTSHDLAAWLMEIKTKPENFTKEQLNAQVAVFEKRLIDAFESRQFSTTFNEELADRLCLKVYGPIVRDFYNETDWNNCTRKKPRNR
jgi:predicted nucleotidyltransferase